MIEVKGTKTETPEADASRRYVLKNMEAKSKTPLAIGFLLTGLALYLKSFFPGWATTPEKSGAKPNGEVSDEAAAAEPAAGIGAPAPEPAKVSQDDDQKGGTVAPEGGDMPPGGSALANVQSLRPMPFALVESPAFDFIEPKASSGIGGVRPAPLLAHAANDNGAVAGAAGSGGGGVSSAPDGRGDAEDGTGDDPEDEDYPPPDNRAPRVTGPVYLMDVVGCATLAVGLSDLLRNAHDPDGDTLSVKNPAVSSGTLTRTDDGWVFDGSPDYLGLVTITYQITDGEATIDQVAYFSVVRPPPIEGTAGADMLLGGMCADEIAGADGDDNIDGRTGDDFIAGGNGDDHIVAGGGGDVVFGGDGDDVVFGGAGNDHISGGNGDDTLFGNDGDDTIFGDGGSDLLNGGAGRDLLFGGDGGDVLSDGEGADIVHGGYGDDRVVAALDGDGDAYDGGEGHDTLDYSGASEDLAIDLVDGAAGGVEIGDDHVIGFESVMGGEGDDHFVVGDKAVILSGGGGEDIFEFSNTGPPVEGPGVSHEILDFTAGDRIRMSRYDIFEKVLDELEDRFEDIYGDDVDDDDLAIRYRHDRTEEMDRTFIEVDLNRDDVWETTVALQGHYALVAIENV